MASQKPTDSNGSDFDQQIFTSLNLHCTSSSAHGKQGPEFDKVSFLSMLRSYSWLLSPPLPMQVRRSDCRNGTNDHIPCRQNTDKADPKFHQSQNLFEQCMLIMCLWAQHSQHCPISLSNQRSLPCQSGGDS